MFGLGGAAGGVAGGAAGSWLAGSAPAAALPLVFGATQAAATLPMLWLVRTPLLEADGTVRSRVYAVAAAAGFFASLTGPNLKAILLNVNSPGERASALSAAYLVDALMKGTAPILIGLAVAQTGARVDVFSVAMLGWVVSGAIIASAAATVAEDERAVANLSSTVAAPAAAAVASSTFTKPQEPLRDSPALVARRRNGQ